jgi:hypothetical protein
MESPKILGRSSMYSGDVRAIVALFTARGRGQIVTYDEISRAIGRNFLEDRSPWASARRRLVREGVITQNVPKVGYKILDTQEVVTTKLDSSLAGIRRKAKRVIQETVSGARAEEMTPAQITGTNHVLSHLGTVVTFSAPRQIESSPKPVLSSIK